MKRISLLSILLAILMASISFVSCSDEDSRAFEGVKIVGVKINNELYVPTYDENSTIITVAPGMDISNVKVEILVANGDLVNFTNNQEYDCRKPFDVEMNGYSGTDLKTTLKIQSAPKLLSFIIDGLNVPKSDVHESSNSIIVQVPVGTDLKALKASMEFKNGTLVDFTNGSERDYTNPIAFNVLGVDEATKYPYQLIITTEPVGPAFIKSMTSGGVTTTKVETSATNVVTGYFPYLLDFSNINITLGTGFGNVVDPAFTGQGLDLLSGNNKVSIKGSDGITKEFTLGIPQLDVTPKFFKAYESLGVSANDAGAVGLTSDYVLVANYSTGAKTPAYYDFSGNKVGTLSAEGCVGISYGFRKFAIDDDGVIIGSSLGMSAGEQWIYKWSSVTAKPEPFISFSMASLGVTNPRAAGLNVTGSLKGNAVITMPIAQTTKVAIWTVTNGVVGAPKVVDFEAKFSYYASVEPIANNGGFVVTATSTNFNGIAVMDNNFQEKFKLTGMPVTDSKVIIYNGRTYLGYVVLKNSKENMMRLCDITSGLQTSAQNPIMDVVMDQQAANVNNTMDVDMRIINGQLYAAYVATNSNLYLYKLTK